MKKILITIIILLTSNIAFSIGTTENVTRIQNKIIDNISIDGSAELSKVKCKSAYISGSLNFSEIKVEEKLRLDGNGTGNEIDCNYLEVAGSFNVTDAKTNMTVISGSLNATNMTIVNNLKLEGSLNANNLMVDGYTEIDGAMNVLNSKFNDIVLTSTKSTITDSSTGNITVRSDKNNAQQLLIIKGDTVINGNIVFASGSGIVVMDPSVKLTGTMYGCTQQR